MMIDQNSLQRYVQLCRGKVFGQDGSTNPNVSAVPDQERQQSAEMPSARSMP
jgi:hypothetical protein